MSLRYQVWLNHKPFFPALLRVYCVYFYINLHGEYNASLLKIANYLKESFIEEQLNI